MGLRNYAILVLLARLGAYAARSPEKLDPTLLATIAVKQNDESRARRLLRENDAAREWAKPHVDHGIEVVPIDYSECQKNGGGIHCSTAPLIRDRH